MQTNSFQKYLPEIIERVGRAASFPLDKRQSDRLAFYFSELLKWNRVTNLTGIKDMETLVIKHLGDTILLLKQIHSHTGTIKTILDIGTGAGIPGLILKLITPEFNMVLAEALKKKCSFLRFVVARLALKNIFVEEKSIGPANPPKHLPENGFDLIVSQATGSVRWFIETGIDFMAPSGSMVLLKGPAGESELKKNREFLKKKGLCYDLIRTRLPILRHQRLLISIRQEKENDLGEKLS